MSKLNNAKDIQKLDKGAKITKKRLISNSPKVTPVKTRSKLTSGSLGKRPMVMNNKKIEVKGPKPAKQGKIKMIKPIDGCFCRVLLKELRHKEKQKAKRPHE